MRDFDASVPSWGMSAAPLVDGDRLIALVGGEPNAKVMAFNKHTGEEMWRALSSDWEPGYNQPTIITHAGVRQLIIWHPRAISSLDPVTGKIYWEVPSEVDMGMTVATPVHSGSHLLVTSFYNGARMLKLDNDKPGASMLWAGKSNSEVATDAIHSTISTPVIDGNYIYGVDSHGELRCLELATGKRVWESMALVKERARWATAFLVKNGDRYFINNDRGELVIAKLSPSGFHEISRTQLIEPTHPYARRRELGAVHWSHPGVREQAHLRAQRSRDPEGLAREGAVVLRLLALIARRCDPRRPGASAIAADRRHRRSAHGTGPRRGGNWHAVEDFRWRDEFIRFLDALNAAGRRQHRSRDQRRSVRAAAVAGRAVHARRSRARLHRPPRRCSGSRR